MACLRASDNFRSLPEPMKIHLVAPGQEALDAHPRGYVEENNANSLASKNAALAVENARLARDNLLMRLQSHGTMPMTYAPPGLHDRKVAQSLWEVPRMGLHPQWCQDNGMGLATKMQACSVPKACTGQNLNSKRDSSTTDSTASGDFFSLLSSDSSEIEGMGALASTPSHMRTTVMIRNLPKNLDRDGFLQLVNAEGFEGTYNLLYLPIDFKSGAGLGYAFIDFQYNSDAVGFFEKFHGCDKWAMESNKVCDVTWSVALQGIDEHVKRYRNSPVMHESVAEEYRPLLFKDGNRVPFPEPTKRIKAPRQWPRRH